MLSRWSLPARSTSAQHVSLAEQAGLFKALHSKQRPVFRKRSRILGIQKSRGVGELGELGELTTIMSAVGACVRLLARLVSVSAPCTACRPFHTRSGKLS